MKRTCAWLLVAAALGASAAAQESRSLQDWLRSAEAQSFRARVIELALIYRESSGIDPQGLRIVARRVADTSPGCARVQVQAFAGGKALLEESVDACRH